MIVFQVNDMSCGHCAGAITQAVKRVDQGAKIQIDVATHRVEIEPVSAGADALAAAIKDAGYSPLPIAVA